MRRRSRLQAAQERRAAQADADARLNRIVTQFATAGVLFAFLVGVVFTLRGPEGFAALEPLLRPAFGSVTWMEVIGVTLTGLAAIVMWRRLRR